MRIVLDIESSNLLEKGLDFSVMPLKLKADYNVWCIVFTNVDTLTSVGLRPHELTRENVAQCLEGATEIVGHNIINFDLPVMKLAGLIDYTIAYPDSGVSSTLNGVPVVFNDTLIWSKLLNPDRFGGHGLAAWGQRLGNAKIDFHDFSQFTEEMFTYCIQDTIVNAMLVGVLAQERGNWNWDRAYNMEAKLVDITLQQQLVGFDFNQKLAQECVVELNTLMKDIKDSVDPILPPKRLNKGEQAKYTPPKIQFKKDGSQSAALGKWCEKVGATVLHNDTTFESVLEFQGKRFKLPYHDCVCEGLESDIDDLDNLKGYLLDLGWQPSEWKERDLTKNSDKTTRDMSKITDAIQRYVDETSVSEYREHRLKILEVDFDELQYSLMDRVDGSKPVRVPTSPCLRVGVEKEICPNLISMGGDAHFVKSVTEYLTYKHRRNSIAGGLDDEGEPTSGFLSNIREDGRISTPADTLGANTGRYRHKVVCNIPRNTSLYGEKMRSLFGAGKGMWQLGFDFASLEARVQGHYCLPFTDGELLAESLVAEKPNDIHSVNARKLGIDRSSAKSFSYATLYGAQPTKLSKMLGVNIHRAKELYNSYWEAVPALKELKDKVEGYWTDKGKQYIVGIDGRKLMTRSKHSLINVLFQSGGAILAKWSIVRIAQLLEEQGILGDVFTNTFNDVKVWQMIVMHDEAQYAVHPSLLNVTLFGDDEKAEQMEGLMLSAIGHGRKGAYRASPTAPVVSISDGITQACTELDLRVELGMEWICGQHWGMCH